ncbi:transcriptional regulator [Microbacterium sp. MPKO10]|uniref:transcriptional regulator n=1 Tax=Microbacterium sp. MPKO10 TaxID=2989818 RepID=UPI00223648A0|nr:transcriptional regulator [Microbacterium sp. MPKO10]MCW4459170.1 transcriptional regulator [Microbacterium sp. MPKO10]
MRGVDASLSGVLHGIRILGFADADAVARRVGMPAEAVAEALEDAEAHGWTSRAGFADLSGWTLTERGRIENERLLAEELERVGGGEHLREVYREFLPLNERLLRACTDWQLRPNGDDDERLIPNDHADADWDARVLRELSEIEHALAPISEEVENILNRFGGYDVRFTAALRRARGGELEWVAGSEVDSCHRVWFELHEDLIATLGIDRSAG